jgi:hypothetical protein
VSRARYQVNTLVQGWKVETSSHGGRHLTECPNVPKFGLIFRRGLQIELCEALKHSAFFSFRWKLFGALPKVAPRRTAGNETIWPKHLKSPLSR